jgi:hypothetical protein
MKPNATCNILLPQWRSRAAIQTLARHPLKRFSVPITATGDTTLGHVIRERRDVIGDGHSRHKLLSRVLGRPANRRNPQEEEEQRARLAAMDARIASMGRTLAKVFPEYAALAKTNILTHRVPFGAPNPYQRLDS